jgi:hypothetical protein
MPSPLIGIRHRTATLTFWPASDCREEEQPGFSSETSGNGLSRYNRSGFADLAAWIAEHLRVESAVLDGEIACVDELGRPVFRDLLFRRRQCVFIAFDLLFLNGRICGRFHSSKEKPRSRNYFGESAHESCTSITSRRWTWRVLSASVRTRHTR